MKVHSTFYVLVFLMAVLGFSMPFVAVAQQNSDTTAILLIGDHQGIDEIDAQSASLLVAMELRKQGIAVSDPVYEAPASANVYRVAFRRLGEKILVHVSQETPVGTLVIEEQLWIANIEEMIAAAPRLVDALVRDRPKSKDLGFYKKLSRSICGMQKRTVRFNGTANNPIE